MISHKRALRDAHVLVSQGLPAPRHRRLREHLRDCDDCLRQYERLRAVEDALTPAAVISGAALERLGELVVDASAPAPRRPAFAWLGALGTAAAMAMVLLLAMPRTGDDELTPRGGSTAVTGHGLAVFVIDPVRGEASRAAFSNDGPVVVPAGKVVQLAYRNSGYRYGAVVGINASYRLEWYHPTEAERASGGVPLVAGAADEPFPGAWSMDQQVTPVRLFAIFSDTPIDAGSIARAVDSIRASGRSVRDLERLPDISGAQDTLLLDVGKQ